MRKSIDGSGVSACGRFHEISPFGFQSGEQTAQCAQGPAAFVSKNRWTAWCWYFQSRGACLFIAEDVGRHNAVDKVIGQALRSGQFPILDAVLVVSSRAGFEIVQKAVMARIDTVVSVGAASSLADELALKSRLNMYSFVRDDGFNSHHPNS